MQEKQERVKKYYDEIMNLLGADEFKEIVRWIKTLSQKVEATSDNSKILPIYFWILKRGGGIHTFVNLFSEYLAALELIAFAGTEKFIMHALEYTDLKSDPLFSELTRLDNTMKAKAGYHRFFRGVVCIDIGDWINQTNERRFQIFLRYLDSKRDKILPILYIHRENENIINNIEQSFSSHIRFDTVRFRFPKPTELVDFIEQKYLKYNSYKLSCKAKEDLTETIYEIIKGYNFNGFITIEQIAQDLLYFLIRSKIKSNEITHSVLADFVRASDYINRLKSQTATIIGFN